MHKLCPAPAHETNPLFETTDYLSIYVFEWKKFVLYIHM